MYSFADMVEANQLKLKGKAEFLFSGFAIRSNTDALAQRCLLEKQEEYDNDPGACNNLKPETILKRKIQTKLSCLEISCRLFFRAFAVLYQLQPGILAGNDFLNAFR